MTRRELLPVLSGYTLMVYAEPQPGRTAADFQRIAPPNSAAGKFPAEPNMALVELNCDVLVAGGGLAGVCAALAAARHGAKVILVQDRSRLGGNSSSEVKMHVVGANCHKSRPGWREGGILEELRLDDAVRNPHRSWELWDFLLYDKVISEPNIALLLESTLYGVTVKGSRIETVMVRCDKSEVLYRIRAKVFCDCTGDCRLGLEAGAEMRWGREPRSEFNESLAPESPDRETLGSSILFTARDYGRPIPFYPPAWARKLTKEHLKFRPTNTWEYGYWWIECGGHLDTIRENERIRYELLAIVMGVWDYIKNSGDHPSSANWGMDWVGMMPGKRASRRLIGDVILTENHLLRGDFEDAVAIGGWPMDDHPSGGFDRSDIKPAQQIHTPEVYNIPLRCLYSKNVENLMMAGRNISASHVAFTSTRVMATCAVEGQAVGTAASMCARQGITPRELYRRKSLLAGLQQTLLRDDQSIKGRASNDPRDLARKARATASSELDDSPARKVIDGYVRNIPGREIHQWASTMAADGAWIDLAWDRPQRLSEVQLTFDTGFQRELTLTSLEGANRTIIRAAQPETVKDYTLLYRKPGSNTWTEIRQVKGNYQRLNRLRFEPVEAEAIRVHVLATNGIQFARIFEVRCYSG